MTLWEWPQLLLAKVKNANGQDWYILLSILLWGKCRDSVKTEKSNLTLT